MSKTRRGKIHQNSQRERTQLQASDGADHKSFHFELKDHILPLNNQLQQTTSGSDWQSHLLHCTGEYWSAPGLCSTHSCSHCRPVTAAQNHGENFTEKPADDPSIKSLNKQPLQCLQQDNSRDQQQNQAHMRGAPLLMALGKGGGQEENYRRRRGTDTYIIHKSYKS